MSWVCAQIWSKARMLRWGLWLLAATGEGVSVVNRNTELGFGAPFLCPRFSERVEFGKREKREGGEREEWRLLGHTGATWRFQPNISYFLAYLYTFFFPIICSQFTVFLAYTSVRSARTFISCFIIEFVLDSVFCHLTFCAKPVSLFLREC